MRIEVKGRNVTGFRGAEGARRQAISDDRQAGVGARRAGGRADRGAQSRDSRVAGRRGDPPSQGGDAAGPRAPREMSRMRSTSSVDELTVQVKRHRDKRRDRREARSASLGPATPNTPLTCPTTVALATVGEVPSDVTPPPEPPARRRSAGLPSPAIRPRARSDGPVAPGRAGPLLRFGPCRFSTARFAWARQEVQVL